MAQGIIGGATSYNEQSLLDILSDINDWIAYTSDRKAFILAQREKLNISHYWNTIPFNFQMTILTTISYFNTILYDLNLVKKSIENNCITEKEVLLLRNIGKKSIEYNCEYGRTYNEERRWKDYGNTDFRVAEEVYGRGRDYFVTMQDAGNAASRLEDYMEKGQVINNTLNIGGNVSGSLIQQNTINSSQTMTVENNFDYDKIMDVLNKIQRTTNSSDFQEDFTDKAEQVKEIISETIQMLQKKEEPSKIKKALTTLKNLAVGISGSIIASGIVGLIAQLPIW
ncbi:hypothetical protein [Anaeromicropila populeti]|uniref:Uncharacterized protein n=1 Tax=Anaeromicropila populeti TaxID=37658 RepID=A0A1I6IWV9_9FIRM|nr:hypothetical protein [Anaeromicropila populeti]SFR71222.1 hypothetical protein SAMN05661086_01202 [Anaeromicropila populeti]